MANNTKNNKLDTRDPNEMLELLAHADFLVTKDHLRFLEKMPVAPLPEENINVAMRSRIFHIEKIVYDQHENIIQKLTNIYAAAATIHANIAMIIYSDGKEAQLYLGICGENDINALLPKAKTLYNNLVGNFPGSLSSFDAAGIDMDNFKKAVLNRCFGEDMTSVSSVSGVASMRSDHVDENNAFSQGIEKVLDTMKDAPFAAVFIANAISDRTMSAIRAEYETLYSALSPFSKSSLTLNVSDSKSISESLTESVTRSIGTSSSSALSVGTTKSEAISEAETNATTDSTSVNVGFGGDKSPVKVGIAKTVSLTRAKTLSNTLTFGSSESSTETVGGNENTARGKSQQKGKTDTRTEGQSLQLTYENKTVTALLERIDEQLKRLKESESFGMFAAAAYFIAPNEMLSRMAASAYKSIISGKNTALESANVNTWTSSNNFDAVRGYLKNLQHPEFSMDGKIDISPASMVSGQELAIQLGLPRRSVAGVSVIKTASFGRNVLRLETKKTTAKKSVALGTIFHMGKVESVPVSLDTESLSMHTFITGSTGSGKSNTVYQMLNGLDKMGIKFLVVEPAKGEYKRVFGQRKGVRVYGTNPEVTELLRVNPFRFPQGVHILEHLDGLVEIFNVCWPMYAAMPAILKDAIHRAYEAAGWNLRESKNRYDSNLFPTFSDVLDQIDIVLNESHYSDENKGNYIGSLSTRLRSLTNGINGIIFACDDIRDEDLFDNNVIVDLSRVRSTETKSLIMGLMVLKLQEYRMATATTGNNELKHVTVLEEAHNLLKRTSTEQSSEGSNLLGKSVEMLANAIAEMRTYGEGFIIADQSPGLMDMSVIRNTNTKIILRLPDYEDRLLVGRAAGLNDEQIDELSRLRQGVAAVYQNDWIEALLAAVHHYPSEEKVYHSPSSYKGAHDESIVNRLLQCTLKDELRGFLEEIDNKIVNLPLPAKIKCTLFDFKESTNKEARRVAAGALMYELLQPGAALEKAKVLADAEKLKAFMENELRPYTGQLSDYEIDIVLINLITEHSRRNAEYRLIRETFIEYLGKKVL